MVVHRTGGAAAEASTTLLRLDVFGMTSQASASMTVTYLHTLLDAMHQLIDVMPFR